MAPDLLAAVLLWQWQSQPAKCGVLTDARLLASLAPVDQAGVTALLQRWHMQAYDQTVRLELGMPQDAPPLSGLLQNAALSSPDFANRLKQAFRTQADWAALDDLAVVISKPLATAENSEVSNDQLAEHASALSNHAESLAGSGDQIGALKVAHEAVEISRRLAKINPTAYAPVLAATINNLACAYGEAGDSTGAVKAAQEAVEIRIHLAKTNSASCEPELAGSINNLAQALSVIGDGLGALKAAQEAVKIRRRLVETNHTVYEPLLAISISSVR